MTTNELWKSIYNRVTHWGDIKSVYIKDKLVALVAVIRFDGGPSEYWVGETKDAENFSKVERICLY